MEQKYAVVYTRVSTDEQAREGLSLEVQKKLCIDRATQEGYEVLEVITDEGISGFKENRPGMLRLQQLIEEKKVSAIVALSSDRLYRNSKAHLQLMGLIYVNEIHLIYLHQATPDGSAISKVSDGFIAMMNQFQRDQTSDKVKETLYEKARAGYFPGVAPPGYRNVDNPNPTEGKFSQKIIIPDPVTAPLITEIFRLYATGLYSVYDIADQMAKRGLKSRNGYPLSASRVYDLLRNRIYVGEVHWGKGHCLEGKHEPLIDVDTFNRAQQVLEVNNHKACRRRKHRWLLSGFVYCTEHKRRYVAEWHKGKTQAYYHCPNRLGCGKYVRQVDLEGAIAEKFKDLQFSDEFIQLVIEKARRQFMEKRDKHEGRRQGIINRRTAIEVKRKTAEDKLFSGVISDDDFKAARAGFEKELKDIEEELASLEEAHGVDVDVAQEILQLTRNIYRTFKDTKDFDLKRQYLGFFWEKFEVKDGVILNSVPTPLFAELLSAEEAFYRNTKNEKTTESVASSGGIVSPVLLRGQDSNLRPID